MSGQRDVLVFLEVRCISGRPGCRTGSRDLVLPPENLRIWGPCTVLGKEEENVVVFRGFGRFTDEKS